MKKFLTRVELHDANPTQYELLHIHMAQRKFARGVLSDDGRTYSLPTGTYTSFGELSAVSVRDLASAAAKLVSPNHWIMTVEFTDAAWLLHQMPA